MSRYLDYSVPQDTPFSPEEQEKIEGLTRHLSARVGEFFCAKGEKNEKQGTLSVVWEGWDPLRLQEALASREVKTAHQDPALVFYLNPRHSFEDIDFLWGILYSILV